MAYQKKDSFGSRLQEIALFARQLSHPARIVILEMLGRKGPLLAGEIAKELPLSRPVVSQHLKELRESGLVECAIKGTSITYRLDEVGLQNAIAQLGSAFTEMLHGVYSSEEDHGSSPEYEKTVNAETFRENQEIADPLDETINEEETAGSDKAEVEYEDTRSDKEIADLLIAGLKNAKEPIRGPRDKPTSLSGRVGMANDYDRKNDDKLAHLRISNIGASNDYVE